MNQIIDGGIYQEATEWLKAHSNWNFNGEVNKISHEEIVVFVESLYQAGCESISIAEYDWVIEPVYEGDTFQPDMLTIQLPVELQARQAAFNCINNSFPELGAKIKYKDNGLDGLWYFFEPKPQKIVISKKEVTWCS